MTSEEANEQGRPRSSDSPLDPRGDIRAAFSLELFPDAGHWAIVTRDGRTDEVLGTRPLTVAEAIAAVPISRREWVLSHTRDAVAELEQQMLAAPALSAQADEDENEAAAALQALRTQLEAAQSRAWARAERDAPPSML